MNPHCDLPEFIQAGIRSPYYRFHFAFNCIWLFGRSDGIMYFLSSLMTLK